MRLVGDAEERWVCTRARVRVVIKQSLLTSLLPLLLAAPTRKNNLAGGELSSPERAQEVRTAHPGLKYEIQSANRPHARTEGQVSKTGHFRIRSYSDFTDAFLKEIPTCLSDTVTSLIYIY